ncbi:hypothetical protein E4U21_002620 [Claviceps maximensis]|nr:hypothetical protein E4U21_002620 [Claviceps maximensis]
MTKGWRGGDDIVYSESFCKRQDILYEGSEDEGYERPADRRRRYEEAGQRFLNGQIPSIMSASLEGPFDRPSGWINPWMSKRNKSIARKTKAEDRSQAHTSRVISTMIRRNQESTLIPSADECHLPSPESLKQAPQTQDHMFLGTEKLDTVKKWQEKIGRPMSNCDSFWNNEKIDSSPPMKKRRASRSEWLKKDSAKRHKPDVQQRRMARSSQDDDFDELTVDMPSSSFDYDKSSSSPSRRKITKKVTRSLKTKKILESDDELSPNKAAAATLSSPVSLQNASRLPFCNDKKAHSDDVISSLTAQSTPTRLRHVHIELQFSGEVESHQSDCIDNDAMSCEEKDMTPDTSESPVPDSPNCASFGRGEVSNPNVVTEPVQKTSHAKLLEASATDQEKILISNTSNVNSNTDATAGLSLSCSADSTQKEAPNSSFRDILSRLVPSSPWKRLSHLASGSPLLAVRSACQAPFSQQDSSIVEPPVHTITEEAASPVIDESADSRSMLASPSYHEKCSKGVQCSTQNRLEDYALLHEEQTVPETAECHTRASSNENTQNTESPIRNSVQQQGPWVTSDESIVSQQHLATLPPISSQLDCVSQVKSVIEAQSPWIPQTELRVEPDNLDNSKHIISEDSATCRVTQPRPRTPEPQFCFKPFASFMSPSPDRSQNKTSWRSISKAPVRGNQASHPSILKGNGRQFRSKQRVSWAAPLTEFHGSPLQNNDTATMCIIDPPKRQRSPPPETSMVDVSKYCDDKFSKHFEAIAKRKDDGTPNLLPTAFAKSRPSVEPFIMDESLLPAGPVIHDDDEIDLSQKGTLVSGNQEAERPICERGSEEPMDMMEDMVREMGDFWDPWNVDSELEQARKNGSRLSVAGN